MICQRQIAKILRWLAISYLYCIKYLISFECH